MFEIFQYDFMVRAIISGLIIGLIAPVIGMFLVVRRYSLIADTLAHVSLVGVAGSILLKINPIIGSLIISTLASFGMESLRGTKKLSGESILALFLSGSLAIALILFSFAKGLNVNILGYLFGSITTIAPREVNIIVTLGIILLFIITVLYRQLFFISFDEEVAKASGIQVKLLNIVLIVLTAITVSVAMRLVGTLLIGALMIIPVISAIQYKLGFRKSLLLAILFSLLSIVIGLYSSFYFNIPSGGAIVLSSLGLFIGSLFLNRIKLSS